VKATPVALNRGLRSARARSKKALSVTIAPAPLIHPNLAECTASDQTLGCAPLKMIRGSRGDVA
jgi:hypothetical protein